MPCRARLGLPRKVADRRRHGRIAAVVAPTQRSVERVARLGPMGGERHEQRQIGRRCEHGIRDGVERHRDRFPDRLHEAVQQARLDAEPIAFDRQRAAGQVDRFPALVDGRCQSAEARR